jgi:hypothetical protein
MFPTIVEPFVPAAVSRAVGHHLGKHGVVLRMANAREVWIGGYDIISVPEKRVTLVTSRSVDPLAQVCRAQWGCGRISYRIQNSYRIERSSC